MIHCQSLRKSQVANLSLGRLFFALLTCFLLSGCDKTKKHSGDKKNSILPKTEISATFQELGFFGPIKENQWTNFVQAVQNNISHSRHEEGNLAFSLYRPQDDGTLRPIWFERFKNKASHNHHKEQKYFEEAIQVIQKSLEGTPKSIELKELKELPAVVPKPSHNAQTTRYIISLFNVKPQHTRSFIGAMADVARESRKNKDNLEFNFYRYAGDPNNFVVMEGWENAVGPNAQFKENHIKYPNAQMNDFFLSDPLQTKWLVKDISPID